MSPSPEQLEDEITALREDLGQTLEEIRRRASPAEVARRNRDTLVMVALGVVAFALVVSILRRR